MRYFSLGLVSLGALFFPFAAKRLVLGLSDMPGGGVAGAIVMMVVGAAIVAAGVYVSKQDEMSSVWRNKSRSRRIKLRG